MNAYEIISIPDPVLKQVAQPIERITPDIKQQAEDMQVTLDEAGGIGLAANQVGVLNRMIIFDVPQGCWEFGAADRNGVLTIESGTREGERRPLVMINPEIVHESEQKSVYEEGCLSIPGQYGMVIRPAHVKATYLDLNGQKLEGAFSGLDAHCLQHEIDHLNGVLFIDYLSSLKRNMILRKFKKIAR